MSIEEATRISKEINYDKDRGIYEQFPKLKKQLIIISGKLIESIMVINSQKQLSLRELTVLKEQGYIDY
jgi:hypothetical protein